MPPTDPPQISDFDLLRAAQELVFVADCRYCKRAGRVNLWHCVGKLGQEFQLHELSGKLRCENCRVRPLGWRLYWRDSFEGRGVMERWPMPGD